MSGGEGNIVQFDNVGLRYGTEREVLSDIAFTLYPGSFYFLTGASGAGLALGLTAMMLLGRQFAALGSGMVAGGELGPVDWALLAAIPVVGVAMAVLTARMTVLSALRRIL